MVSKTTAAHAHLARASPWDFGGCKNVAEYVRGLALVIGDLLGYVALTLPLTSFSRAAQVFSRLLELTLVYYLRDPFRVRGREIKRSVSMHLSPISVSIQNAVLNNSNEHILHLTPFRSHR